MVEADQAAHLTAIHAADYKTSTTKGAYTSTVTKGSVFAGDAGKEAVGDIALTVWSEKAGSGEHRLSAPLPSLAELPAMLCW